VFPGSLTVAPILDEAGAVTGTTAIPRIPRDVTEQRRVCEAAQHMAAIVENSEDAIISGTLDGTITSWNSAAERMYGYSSAEIIGKSAAVLSTKGRVGETRATLARIGAGGQVERVETTRVRKDGTTISVALTFSPICHPDGTVVGVSTIARDLTEQHHAAKNARNLVVAEELVHTVMAAASFGIAMTDSDGFIKVVNHSLCDLLGRDQAWFLGRRFSETVHPNDADEATRARVRLLAAANNTISGQLRLVRADGATVWVRHLVVPVQARVGQPDLYMIQVEDITAEHDAQEALGYQAFHDPLTGLHNRAWVMDILKADLRAAKLVGASVGTLFVDLDKFNVVNDSLGHEAGDEVLTTVAERIVAVLGPGDRVGRFGGDSFVIVVQNVDDILQLEHLAGRVSASIANDLQVRGHRIVPTASIGIAVSTLTSTPESMLRDTDAALFRAKTTGRGRWQLFDDAMHAQAVARLIVEDQLRDAITAGQFVVYYQPIVALADAHVVGHEALVRWAHPTRGLLSPGDFIEVAEDCGLITAIGAEVLDQVCALLASRPDLPGPISVNVSAVQLGAPDWLGTVTDTLAAHGVDPSRLVIEITETAALDLADFALKALTTLSGLGVGIHLDDFGTGYSSISVLRDLPVTGVKLDLRFVHDLTSGKSQANALAHGLSTLVNGMHLTGIAEGIETQMQAHILRAQGWNCGQGYYYGRPAAMPAVDIFTDGDLIA
jgi:diguanylate cyclase (GGDEF)-like protein/PAS domain S-box-containing protein